MKIHFTLDNASKFTQPELDIMNIMFDKLFLIKSEKETYEDTFNQFLKMALLIKAEKLQDEMKNMFNKESA